MKRSRGRVVHVESVEELDRRLAAGATSLRGWRLRAVDLTERHDVLADVPVAGATFLACDFAPGDDDLVAERGGLVLQMPTDMPVEPRHGLYSPAELYDSPRYTDSLDAAAYAWSQRPADPDAALGRALHDHTIDRALEEWADGRDLVGIMGGHRQERGSAAYADAARLGNLLGERLVVATGGGPGAMEAANLGAYLAGSPDAVGDALGMLATVPSYRPSIDDWVGRTFEVLRAHPDGAANLGIPTWHYGHEPPNAFATAIAKYFRNSTREATLLEVCSAGIVFLPGQAGTVQEVFQDACENFYADETSLAPMVLVGREYWTETLPVWPLLRSLAEGRPMEPHVHLVESVEEADAVIADGPTTRFPATRASRRNT